MMSETFARVYWIHATTPLHVGAGRGMGFIDLPVMREAVTNWPFVPGSAVKGVLADHYQAGDEQRKQDPVKQAAFGSPGAAASAGSIVFTDSRIVCLPARSFYGTFAWCSSPLALRRLARDFAAVGIASPPVPSPPVQGGLLVPSTISSVLTDSDSRAFFEDLDFSVEKIPESDAWANAIAERAFTEEWRPVFRERFAIINDDVFGFLCETATQVDARVQIDDVTGTASGKALWYEESLPAETLLAGMVRCGQVFCAKGTPPLSPATLMSTFCDAEQSVQMGGKASVGRGRVRVVFSGKA